MRAKFSEREKFKELEFKQREAQAGMWFGVVTGETMDMVKNEADQAQRAEGAFRLRRELEGRRGNLSPLVPHMAELLEFLGTDLMTDVNPKVVLHAIEAHETVIVQGGEPNHGKHVPRLSDNIHMYLFFLKYEILGLINNFLWSC